MKKIGMFCCFLGILHGSVPTLVEREVRGISQERNIKGLREVLDEMLKEGFVERCGTDSELRPIFVAIQGMVESSLASMVGKNVIDQFKGAIHTPAPATPLCTAETIEEPLLKKTHGAKDRTVTLRELLSHGGKLLIVYPEGGLEKRSEEQRKIYQETTKRYKNIFDCPIKGVIEEPFIGATYLFVDPKEGKTYLFSIEPTQSKGEMVWRAWFDDVDATYAKERLKAIDAFLKERAGCTIRDFDTKRI